MFAYINFGTQINSDIFYTIKELKSFNLEGQLKDLSQEESVYVMIIGESGSKYHFPLYGYFRETNPKLQTLKNNGELSIFDNIIAPNSVTKESLQKVLTLKDSKNGYKFYESSTLDKILKEKIIENLLLFI